MAEGGNIRDRLMNILFEELPAELIILPAVYGLMYLVTGKTKAGPQKDAPIVDVRAQLLADLLELRRTGNMDNIFRRHLEALKGKWRYSENTLVRLLAKFPTERRKAAMEVLNQLSDQEFDQMMEFLLDNPIRQTWQRIVKVLFPSWTPPKGRVQYRGILSKMPKKKAAPVSILSKLNSIT